MFGLAYHRHFTHSIFFVPFGAAIVAGFLWLVTGAKHSFKKIYIFSIFGMLTHGILDSLTNYGTHLFWPFTHRRESWSVISIIDPIFTLTLLTLLVIAAKTKNIRYTKIGAIFAILYLLFGFSQREQATDAMQEIAVQRGDMIEKFEVKPSIGNMFLWRAQYLAKDKIVVDAFHVSAWNGKVYYAGGSLPVYKPSGDYGAIQTQDLKYFTFFSDGWVAEAPNNSGLIGDIRFANLPNALDPIWGIRFQPNAPEKHVLFENVRNIKDGDFATLWNMILGRKI
jgi:inner membrane protein